MILDGKKWELTKNHPINGVFEKKKNETIGFIPKI
jgi:hypothetical protein